MYRPTPKAMYLYQVKGKQATLIIARRGECPPTQVQPLLCKTYECLQGDHYQTNDQCSRARQESRRRNADERQVQLLQKERELHVTGPQRHAHRLPQHDAIPVQLNIRLRRRQAPQPNVSRRLQCEDRRQPAIYATRRAPS